MTSPSVPRFGPPRREDRPLFRPLHRVYQSRIWVHGLPLPPQPFRPQLEDRKMQVGPACIRISRRSHKTDDVPTLDSHFLPQAFHVPVQVRVVIAIHSQFIELVDCVAARFAEEHFADGSGYHRMHGCASRLQNVDRLMPMSVVNFFERIPKIREGESADGRSHLKNGRGRANRKKHREKHGNTNAESHAYSSRMTGLPRRTVYDGSSTFHFVIRMHPPDSACRICRGSGVPWSASTRRWRSSSVWRS